MTVFVDTSAILALMSPDDRFHQAAATMWRQWASQRPQLITSNYIVLETVALLQRRVGLDAVRSFHERLLPVMQVEWVTPETHRRAVTAVLAAERRDLSLVDCTSFDLMRNLDLEAAFTFDDHFAEQGFTRLP